VKFTVTKDGRTDDVQLAGGDAPESAQRSTVSAIKKARYSPKFEAGEPVEAQGVTLREKILVKAKSSSS
jgi:TonB family protein